MNGCVLAANGKSWKALPRCGWGRMPYDRGLAFYAIGLSSDVPRSTLLRLRDYNRKGKQGERTEPESCIGWGRCPALRGPLIPGNTVCY